METQRYMDEEHLETWTGTMSAYKEMNGIVVPTAIEAHWKLAQGDFPYAKFTVKAIEYDKPEKF